MIVIFMCVVATFLVLLFQSSSNVFQKTCRSVSFEKVLPTFSAKTWQASTDFLLNEK